MTTQPSQASTLTHYEILNLPSPLHHKHGYDEPLLRRAYKRTLLQHHPDKTTINPSHPSKSRVTYSIDQITTAYTTLSDPKTRAKYDSELKLQRGGAALSGLGEKDATFRTGIETVDLDDLEIDDFHSQDGRGDGIDGEGEDEAESIWYKSCRCGDPRGFEIREGELEKAADCGEKEVVVGCRGCSLWLRVLFGVLEEEG